MINDKTINIFISYSWDSLEHREWVEKLAKELDEYKEFHISWDGFDLDLDLDKNFFMEKNISQSDYICIVTTKKYKEKADERSGGVGIETFISSAIHWEEMEKRGKSRLVIIQREKDSIPSYLAGRVYKDFSDNSKYPKSLNDLVRFFVGDSRVKRPKKIKSINDVSDDVFSFTRLEEVVKLNSSKRSCLVSQSEGTDFSGSNRIKYEIWETHNPSVNYFVGLADNINYSQTLDRVSERLKGISSGASITILRPRLRGGDQSVTRELFRKKGVLCEVYEYTYKKYVWEFCVSDELRSISMPDGIPNYTDQALIDVDSGGVINSSALDLIEGAIKSDVGSCAHIVFGSGGMGKTSLCISVAKRLYNRSDLASSVIFLQADAIKRYVSERGMIFSEIVSIYQLYDIYTKYQSVDNPFSRSAFELAILCGNIIVVIDGLDEIDGVFEDSFSLERFFSSLKEIYSQMGASRVLITSRDSALISDNLLQEYGIKQYKLLGFDSKSCERYVRSRFRQYDDHERIVDKVMGKISAVDIMSDDAGRIVPFFADVVANVVEDEISEKKRYELNIHSSDTPYPSNNELIDHLIFSILKRETVRQELPIDESEVVDFIGDIVSEFGKRWKASEMHERLRMMYDDRADGIKEKISRSPLVKDWGEYIELRYSFLEGYFLVLHCIASILASSRSNVFIKAFSRLSFDGAEFTDVLKYFRGQQEYLIRYLRPVLIDLVDKCVVENDISPAEKEISRRAISVFLYLLVYSGVPKRAQATRLIRSVYGMEESGNAVIKGLFIRGDMPDLDFSDLTVSDSRFDGYARFLASRFHNTKFMYSVFRNCANSSIKNIELDPSMIDSTCELGDLKVSLDVAVDRKVSERKRLESDLKKFLGSFYRGAAFRDNNLAHIKFSSSFPGISKKGFNALLGYGLVVIKERKEVDTFYEIGSQYKESVRKFLNEGYVDRAIKEIMAFACED